MPSWALETERLRLRPLTWADGAARIGVCGDALSKGHHSPGQESVPLENIPDVTLIDGLLLKHVHSSILTFETAGQSRQDEIAVWMQEDAGR